MAPLLLFLKKNAGLLVLGTLNVFVQFFLRRNGWFRSEEVKPLDPLVQLEKAAERDAEQKRKEEKAEKDVPPCWDDPY
jgi:hypothetical protein